MSSVRMAVVFSLTIPLTRSFLAELETTATYDSKTDEFVIHSPTVSATKWFVGRLVSSSRCGLTPSRSQVDRRARNLEHAWCRAGTAIHQRQGLRTAPLHRPACVTDPSYALRCITLTRLTIFGTHDAVRSMKDHSLLTGIEAGEIGPKVHGAMSALDNGWARFDNVRIPRKQMLSRFAQVDPANGGTYVKPPHSKVRSRRSPSASPDAG
jgi:acyl-CoA oxidase